MVRSILAILLLGSLSASAGGGRRANARELRTAGFFTRGPVPFTDYYEDGYGQVSIVVIDKVEDDLATFGDEGHLNATFRVRGDRYDLELDSVGVSISPRAGFGGLAWPGHPIGGGVLLDRDVYGRSGIGWRSTTEVHAAIALWGIGRVFKNGRLVSDHALIHAAAISRGAHADDDTHRLLPQPRDGGAEIQVLAENLPRDVEPTGFIQFFFDHVSIELEGTPVPARAVVRAVPSQSADQLGAPTAPGYGIGFAPPGLYAAAPGSFRSGLAPASFSMSPNAIQPEALIRTEAPLNAQALPPQFSPELSRPIATPQPLNAQPATPLIPMEPPINSRPPPTSSTPMR